MYKLLNKLLIMAVAKLFAASNVRMKYNIIYPRMHIALWKPDYLFLHFSKKVECLSVGFGMANILLGFVGSFIWQIKIDNLYFLKCVIIYFVHVCTHPKEYLPHDKALLSAKLKVIMLKHRYQTGFVFSEFVSYTFQELFGKFAFSTKWTFCLKTRKHLEHFVKFWTSLNGRNFGM